MSEGPLLSKISQAIDSGQRWIVWQNEDEQVCQSELSELAKQRDLELQCWSLDQNPDAYTHFDQALERLIKSGPAQARSLWVWLDYDPPAPLAKILQRKLRRVAQQELGAHCVFLQFFEPSSPRPPERFEIRRPSPSVVQLVEHIGARCIESSFGLDEQSKDALYAQRQGIAQRCVGLERWQVDIALRLAAQQPSAQSQLSAIEDYKSATLNADALVELCAPVSEDQLGGLEAYKTWLVEQKVAMTAKALASGVQRPKGALLVGVPGCGKSLAARVTAHQLRLPLYRLDLGRLFTGVLGGSEARMRKTLSLCERLAPAVLWIDEVEKGLSCGNGQSDGGTAQRSLATLMTWLQEHQSPIFLVATANRIDTLPPEFTRRGRLDETFFVDLPDRQEREAILHVYGVHEWPQDDHFKQQALERSEGYSGAELANAVSQARLTAFIASRATSWKDLVDALGRSVPLSQSRGDAVQEMRNWGQCHARPAHA